MEDLIRLLIANKRIVNNKKNNLELTKEEAHYLNNVMRIKTGKEIFVTNGEGLLWKAKKVTKDFIEISELDKPYLLNKQDTPLLGIAVVIPKNGFEDILRMCTEIGIDFIQPLFSERQIYKNLNLSRKFSRWDTIIKESVEQSERLWKPSILNGIDIINWIEEKDNQDTFSISVTRDDSFDYLNKWLKKQHEVLEKNKRIFWNVIGPEGGWSSKEIEFFIKNKIPLVKLSNIILRTSTATVNASSILNQWRNDLKLEN